VAIPPFFESDDRNFELGYKSLLSDNRVIFNTALFHILWDNMDCRTGSDGAFGFIGNAGKAEVTGLEAEIFASPNENWNLTFGAGWLPKRELTEDQISDEIIAPGKDGDKIPRIPALTLNATAQYSFALPVDGWSGYARGEGFYKSGSSTEFRPSKSLPRVQSGRPISVTRTLSRCSTCGSVL
jgi:outer membrane receptor protein involved in Fe transport